MRRVEVVNELSSVLLSYMMILISDWPSNEARFKYGYVFVICTLV